MATVNERLAAQAADMLATAHKAFLKAELPSERTEAVAILAGALILAARPKPAAQPKPILVKRKR
jgi:hypothetical protein